MSEMNHIHTDDIIVDADEHFTINTVTRAISSASNKKLTIMQYDNRSERYSFSIDRIIDGHDLTLCNRVKVHFNNIGSNRQHNESTYQVDDVHVDPSNENKLIFSWLVTNEATQYSGILSFLVTFECTNGDDILYRWSSSIFNSIQIGTGMNNNSSLIEIYSDELLKWQISMETEYIPGMVDDCYINREFATSEEVGAIFDIYNEVEDILIGVDVIPTDDSKNLIESGGVKKYVDDSIQAAIVSALGGDY